jgi:hypothetical protein
MGSIKVAVIELALQEVHCKDSEHKKDAEYNDEQIEDAHDGFQQGGHHDLHLLVSGDDP